jgi:hypothetical protein
VLASTTFCNRYQLRHDENFIHPPVKTIADIATFIEESVLDKERRKERTTILQSPWTSSSMETAYSTTKYSMYVTTALDYAASPRYAASRKVDRNGWIKVARRLRVRPG